MKRCYSLKRNKNFRHVYRVGKSNVSRQLVLLCARSKEPRVRVGFSVSKKIGNSVVRNRVKRRLREALTPLIPTIKEGYDLIFIARDAVVNEKFTAIGASMQYLLHKANLLKDPEKK